MINFPTNVHPHNNTISIEKQTQSNGYYAHMSDFFFTYTGGFTLGKVEINLFDMNTEKQLLNRSQAYTQLGGNYSKVYSGDNIEFTNTNDISAVCNNGHNYAYNLVLFQYDFNDNPVYDMFLFKGKIKTVLENINQIQLETQINNLYAGYAVIYIGNESRLITNYDCLTGVATIESAFSEALTIDTNFKVYCNYIKSQNYFFKARSLPTISVNLSKEYGQVKASINYSQSENTPLKCWQYSLWQTDNLSKWINGRTPADYTGYEDIIDTRHYYIGVGYTNIVNKTICFDGSMSIDENDDTTYVTPEVSRGYMNNQIVAYNANTGIITMKPVSSFYAISRYIPKPKTRFTIIDKTIPFVKKSKQYYTNNTNYRFPIDASAHSYHIKYSVTTQDNINVVGESDVVFSDETKSLIDNVTSIYIQRDTNSVAIEWDKTENWEYHCPILIFRKDEDDFTYKIIGIATHSDSCFIDYSVANTKTYEYMLMPCKEDKPLLSYKTVFSPAIEVKFSGWTITAITNIMNVNTIPFQQYKTVLQDDIEIFGIGETWKLEGDVQDCKMEQNINKSMQIGMSKYPVVTRNSNNYLSGTFTGLLGHINCETDDWQDDIYLVEKWRKFMADNTQFLLRSSKGDVMCVEVSYSSSPTTVYDEKSHQTITTISFDFVEFENADNLLFVKLDNSATLGTIYNEETEV